MPSPAHVLKTLTFSQKEVLDFSNQTNSMSNEMLKEVTTATTKQLIKHTIASSVMSAIALPLFVSSQIHDIDSTWALLLDRSDGIGRAFARQLLAAEGGDAGRVVDFVGISWGARLVYSCLKELAAASGKIEEMEGEGEGEVALPVEIQVSTSEAGGREGGEEVR